MEHTTGRRCGGGLRLVGHRRLEGGLGAQPAGRGRRGPRGQRAYARRDATATSASDGRLLCVLGVEGLAVVDTADALLVAPIERAQEVKALVADLEARGLEEATTPARVHRPWGWYQTMDLGDRFRVKRLVVAPGKKLSLQKHHHRAEHWVVVRGTAEVTRDHEVLLVHENEFDLPAARAARTGCPTRAGSRSRSSRCRPAPTSGRTTSSGSRTISAACEPDRGCGVSVKFGTSGLRGLVAEMTDPVCEAHVRGVPFASAATGAAPGEVLVGRDLRPSSPRIAAACRRAVRAEGRDGGRLRRGADAGAGARGGAARGGGGDGDRQPHPLRPQRAEVLPARRRGDQQGATRRGSSRRSPRRGPAVRARGARPMRASARATWRARSTSSARGASAGCGSGSTSTAPPGASTCARRWRRSGRRSCRSGAATSFVPIDTEAIPPERGGAHPRLGGGAPAGGAGLDRRRRRPAARRRRDRAGAARRRARGAGGAAPRRGRGGGAAERQHRAGALGLVRAGAAHADRLAATSSRGWRGSAAEGARLPVGYEANGGFLLGGTAVSPEGRRLGAAADPRRDGADRWRSSPRRRGEGGRSRSSRASCRRGRPTAAGCRRSTPPAAGRLLDGLAGREEARAALLAGLGAGRRWRTDTLDGVRMRLGSGEIVHLRLSGNAPELRCYSRGGDPRARRDAWRRARARGADAAHASSGRTRCARSWVGQRAQAAEFGVGPADGAGDRAGAFGLDDELDLEEGGVGAQHHRAFEHLLVRAGRGGAGAGAAGVDAEEAGAVVEDDDLDRADADEVLPGDAHPEAHRVAAGIAGGVGRLVEARLLAVAAGAAELSSPTRSGRRRSRWRRCRRGSSPARCRRRRGPRPSSRRGRGGCRRGWSRRRRRRAAPI